MEEEVTDGRGCDHGLSGCGSEENTSAVTSVKVGDIMIPESLPLTRCWKGELI